MLWLRLWVIIMILYNTRYGCILSWTWVDKRTLDSFRVKWNSPHKTMLGTLPWRVYFTLLIAILTVNYEAMGWSTVKHDVMGWNRVKYTRQGRVPRALLLSTQVQFRMHPYLVLYNITMIPITPSHRGLQWELQSAVFNEQRQCTIGVVYLCLFYFCLFYQGPLQLYLLFACFPLTPDADSD